MEYRELIDHLAAVLEILYVMIDKQTRLVRENPDCLDHQAKLVDGLL